MPTYHTMTHKAWYRNRNTVDHTGHHLGLITITAFLFWGTGKVLERPFPHLGDRKEVVRSERTHTEMRTKTV